MRPEAADRTRSAKDALAALAPVLAEPLKLPAFTLDGEPIEVFDQLPPLPEPYAALAAQTEALAAAPTQSAPLDSRPPSSSPQPPTTSPSPERPQPSQLSPSPEPSQPLEPSQSPLPTNASRLNQQSGPPKTPELTQPSEPTQPSPLPQSTEPSPLPGSTDSSSLPAATDESSASGRRRVGVLAAASGVILAAATAVAVLVLDGPPAGKDSPTPQQSSPPATIRTGPVTPAPNAGVKVGGTCGWQEAGNVETTTDGTRIVCRQQGSSYRWVKA